MSATEIATLNLVARSLPHGGRVVPLILPAEVSGGTGVMNPSIFVDDDGSLLVNLRAVNYIMYNCEDRSRFPTIWGPLAYLHPENDPSLRTTNYLARLDANLEVCDFALVDTSALDVQPIWNFVGLEDGRLVKWDGKYYLIGVRRDTTTNGVGRMEFTELDIDWSKNVVKEVARYRIPAPGKDDTYCEKNWMPILDKPFHFVKWSSPTEIVRATLTNPAQCEVVKLREDSIVPPRDQRGGSHVIKVGEYYVGFTHEAFLTFNYLNQKVSYYPHRLCVWDVDFKLVGNSPMPFTFMSGRIEFCTGVAEYRGDYLVSFGYQDNAAYILQMPSEIMQELIEEALAHGA